MKKFLFCILFPASVFGQWNNNSAINTLVCNATGNQEEVKVVSDGAGGTILSWMDSRPTGNSDIYVQRVDSAGFPKWTANGVAICTEISNQMVPAIVEDGSGGAIVVWKDLRNGTSDIYAQRINNSGIVQWTPNGIPVDTKSGDQIDPKIISDGSGGAIVTWQDSMSGNWNIYAQRIGSSGTLLWSAGGVAVCSAADDQKNPRIEAGNSGEAIIVWQDRRNANDYNIYAQKLNSSGVSQWAANGVAVCTSPDTQNNPKIESDGTGGAILGWVDKRNGSDYNIYAQRLNNSGVPQWAANGVAITLETGNQSAIDISAKNINGAVFTWKDYRNNIFADIYAQYIDLSGAVQWMVNGLAISTKPFDQINPNIVTESNSVIIVWQDSTSAQWDIFGQKILLNGTIQWGVNGKVLGNAVNSQTGPKHILDGKGGAIVAWQDNRDTSKYDIYIQNVNSDGSLGVVTGMKEFGIAGEFLVYPNPNDGFFKLQATSADFFNIGREIEIFNVLGEPVFISGLREPVSEINVSGLRCGLYYYRILSGEKTIQTGKILVE